MIEVIVSIAIVISLLITIYNFVTQALKITQENKLRMSATIIANQKMERIRNLPYNSVGTISGIPTGVIADNEVVNDARGYFQINTLVQYVDDPFDGTLGGSPNDLLPTDYKSARVRVRWTGFFGLREVSVFTIIAPRGIETSPGGGTLVINVLNAGGQPVSLADVNVKNNLVTPAINVDLQTATSGIVILPGAPASVEGYEITVSKAGYSTSSTTARTASNTNPTLVNASVYEAQKTETFFFIDRLSTLRLHAIRQAMPSNYRINTDSGNDAQTNSRIGLDTAGNVYVVWRDFRNGSAGKIYAQKYNSAGAAQWTGDQVIGSANNQILPDVAVDSANHFVYICWSDDSNGNQDSFLVKLNSDNGNDLWGGAKKIDAGVGNADQQLPRLALGVNGDIPIVWQDNRAGNNDIYIIRYRQDKNIRWGELKVNTDVGATEQIAPVIAVDSGDNSYIAWTDERNGNQDVYLTKFDLTGNRLWASDLQVTSATSSQREPTVAIDSNDNVYLAWTDERNGNQDVYAQSFTSTGTARWAADLMVNDLASSSNQYNPSIAINASNIIYIAWTDERNGNQDIYAQKLTASGSRQWTADVRVNVNLGNSSQSIPDLTINPVTGLPYATWQDDRVGNFDIYAAEFDQYGGPVNLASIGITLTGAKKIGDNPIIYKFRNNYTTDSNGLINVSNIEWDDYIATSTSAGDVLLMSDPIMPLSLPPNTVMDLNLYFK